jgi:hypothetical protein
MAVMQLDGDNPWPGLESFEENARTFFYGRDHEAASLLNHVLDDTVTVLFGRSGLGKTSLLQAGLFPLLRDRHFLPVYVRFDFKPGAVPLIRQLQQSVLDSVRADVPDAMLPEDDESLWEYLHRADFELWSALNYPLTPVIVLDQFEELFTLGGGVSDLVEVFMNDLGDFGENRIPADLAARIEHDEKTAERYNLRSRNYKLLISLREDFLPELDGWRRLIPALGRSRMRLLPLRAGEALDAVHKPAAHMMTGGVARRVVGIITGEDLYRDRNIASADAARPDDHRGASDVEPALLSLFCRELNQERKRRGQAHFDEQLVEGARRDILSNYYLSCVRDLPPDVARFIESELITEKGFRNSYAREDAVPSHLTEDELSQLIHSRLLRLEERYGAQRIELTHDVLTGVVREQRDRRRTEEEKAALAARMEQERHALSEAAAQREGELDRERRVERERRLESEARAGRRFRWLSVVLAIVSLAAVVLAVLAVKNALSANENSHSAAAARDQAEHQRQLTEQQDVVIRDGIKLKQAVLTGDPTQIEAGWKRSPSQAKFTVTAVDRTYRDSEGHEIFGYTLSPVAGTLPTDDVVAVTYRIGLRPASNAELAVFMNSLFITGSDRGFAAKYEGWGCVMDQPIIVLIEFRDPNRMPELTEFNECKALNQ